MKSTSIISTKYICYYRVSTLRQGASGLGLEAQKALVKSILKPNDKVIFEFTEVESRRKNDRPRLTEAIQACKETGATLLVSNITRLTGNASFFFMLRDSGLPLRFADMLEADELTIGIMALLAERETKTIRSRIKAAFDAKRRRGEKMGSPQNLTREGGKLGNQAMRNKFLRKVEELRPIIELMLNEKKPVTTIISTIPTLYKDKNYSKDFLNRAISEVKVQRALQD